MNCQSPSTNSINTLKHPLNGIFQSCGPWRGWGQVHSLPLCFQHLKASCFWVDNYSVLSQAAVTKEQELPKCSKMHRSLLVDISDNKELSYSLFLFFVLFCFFLCLCFVFYFHASRWRRRGKKKKKIKKRKGKKKELWTFCSSQFPRKRKTPGEIQLKDALPQPTVAGEVATGQIPETRISQNTQTQPLQRCELLLMAAHTHSRGNKKKYSRNGWMNFIQGLTHYVSIMNMT